MIEPKQALRWKIPSWEVLVSASTLDNLCSRQSMAVQIPVYFWVIHSRNRDCQSSTKGRIVVAWRPFAAISTRSIKPCFSGGKVYSDFYTMKNTNRCMCSTSGLEDESSRKLVVAFDGTENQYGQEVCAFK